MSLRSKLYDLLSLDDNTEQRGLECSFFEIGRIGVKCYAYLDAAESYRAQQYSGHAFGIAPKCGKKVHKITFDNSVSLGRTDERSGDHGQVQPETDVVYFFFTELVTVWGDTEYYDIDTGFTNEGLNDGGRLHNMYIEMILKYKRNYGTYPGDMHYHNFGINKEDDAMYIIDWGRHLQECNYSDYCDMEMLSEEVVV